MIEPTQPDILDTRTAGPRVIRGTAVRLAGYGAGVALGLLAVPALTRHLGVADYGSFAVVTSLLAITAIFADAGLTAGGLTEYAVRDPAGRRQLLQSLVAGRLVLASIAGAGAVLFALLARYDSVLVAGTAIGAVGVMLTVAQQTYAIPLSATLRFEVATGLDLLRQVLTVGGILALVAAGSQLLAFFVLPVPVALAVLVATLFAARGFGSPRPAISRDEWRHLIVETLPLAAASVVGALFYRVAIVMMSLVGTAAETGYFGVSLRVADAFIVVPVIIGGSALPLLARAAETDRARLASAFQQLFEVSVVLALGSALALVAGAEPAIDVLGGPDFAPAVSVLQIQGVAVGVTFLVQLLSYTLWALRAKRALVVGNLAGVIAAVSLTAAFVPVAEARGAATAMLIAESFLACWLVIALVRHAPDLRPRLQRPARAAVAASVAALALILPVPAVASLALAIGAYALLLLALRAIPADVWRATIGRLR